MSWVGWEGVQRGGGEGGPSGITCRVRKNNSRTTCKPYNYPQLIWHKNANNWSEDELCIMLNKTNVKGVDSATPLFLFATGDVVN